MKKRYRSLLFVLLTVIVITSNAPAQTDKSKPNILLLLSDDQAWTDYSFMGHEIIKTPNIDSLAKGGVVFRRGYVPTALCRASLSTLATGHYAHMHGVTGNDPSPKYFNGEDMDQKRAELISKIDKFDTLPELLVEQGYLCHQSGKWWEGSYKHGGFTHGMTRGFPEKGGRHGDDGLTIGRTGIKPCKDFIDMALNEKKPFYMWYAPFMPHAPHTPPEKYLDKYKDKVPLPVAKYYAMVEWFDATCGELVDYLEEKGVRDNTLIVYISDNGWIQKPDAPNRYDKRSKQTSYEGGVRQPTIYNWPKILPPQDRPELVSSIDIFPTILAAAGARQPKIKTPGLNLLGYMTEKKPIQRDTIFGESFAHDVADVDDPERTLLYRWCIKGDWKLILSYDGEIGRYKGSHQYEKGPQLFNLRDDPHEKSNLALKNPEKLQELAKAIENWWQLKKAKAFQFQNSEL